MTWLYEISIIIHNNTFKYVKISILCNKFKLLKNVKKIIIEFKLKKLI